MYTRENDKDLFYRSVRGDKLMRLAAETATRR